MTLDFVRHGKGYIFLVVEEPGCGRDGYARHDLANEYYSPAPLTSLAMSNIEAKIDFFEITVEGKRNSHHFCFEETKINQADEKLAVAVVEFRPARHEASQKVGADAIVEQG